MRFGTFADKLRARDPNARVLVVSQGTSYEVRSVGRRKDGTIVISTGKPTS
jgi:hypothetical protein